MKTILIASAAVLALLMSCSPAAKPADAMMAAATKVVVASDTTFPPMEFINDKKEIVGFDIDLMNEIAKVSNLTIENKSVSWDGIFAGLDSGNYDAIASSVTITPDRAKTMDFSEPYINAGQILVVPVASTVTTLKELEGKAVGAQVNTTGSMEVDKHKTIKLKAYDDIALSFDDLANGRVEGVVIDTPVAVTYVSQNPKYKGKFKMVGEPMTQEFYGLVVKKGNAELLAKLNAGLKAVTDSGKLKELEAKWLK